MLILSLPLLGLGSNFTSLSPGFCVGRPRQYGTICWKLDLISGFLFFPGSLFMQIKAIIMVSILEEAGDTDSMVRTRSQM